MKDEDQVFVENFFSSKKIYIKIKERLAGGVISSVWNGIFIENDTETPCVIKYTKDRPEIMPIPFNSRVDHFVSGEGHNLDTDMLIELSKLFTPDTGVVFPKILAHFPEEKITVMENLSESPYNLKLFAHDIIGGINTNMYATNLGIAIATIQNNLLENKNNFKPTEGSLEQFEERGRGALFAFHNLQVYYKKFLDKNTDYSNPLILTDIHPKNLFFGKDGTCAVIDYGRTVFGDVQFPLPNFLSHIFLLTAIGTIDMDKAFKFIDEIIFSYRKISKIDINEEMFCFYVGIEILGRACGRWVNYVDEHNDIDKKTALTYLGQYILTKNIKEIKALKDIVAKVHTSLLDNKFAII